MAQVTEFIDLSDHDAFVEAVPHEAFAALREHDPVHWNPEPGGPGFWAVTRFGDIRAVHRDVGTYSSEIGGTSLEDLEPEYIEARKSMLDMDPPRHDELRGLIARRFTPRAVGVWEEQVRTVTREVLDRALPMGEFGRRLAAQRRKDPRNDIITQLAFEPLTQQEFDVYFVLLATAGNETTRHTITHGLLGLLEHPDELARLRDDPSLGKSAAEEMLRWATPVHHFRRTAAVDTELAGTEIKAGDKVTTWFVSGNRDETVFEDPYRFDVGRTPNPHMAFGPGGIHHCMGAHLARMEVRIAFEELLARTDRIELTGPPERLRSNFFNGIKRLPVRVAL